jgi:hypothetical protein
MAPYGWAQKVSGHHPILLEKALMSQRASKVKKKKNVAILLYSWH